MKAADLHSVSQLMAAYFHQDWDLEGESGDAVIAQMVRDYSMMEERFELAELLRRFATEVPDDALLERCLLTDLGCYYLPSADGVTAREWLNRIADQLSGENEGQA